MHSAGYGYGYMAVEFELPELVGLDLRASSCFRRLEVEEHLSLLPCYIGRIGDGVLEYLNGKTMRYSECYSGVLLSYSNPTVLQTTGRIMDEQPHLHFDVRFVAYIFKPVVGSMLSGTVNKVGRDHIGCHVYRCFNASVVQRRLLEKRSKGHNDNGLWTNFSCEIGAKIWFRVIQLEVIAGVLSIKGEQVDMDEALGIPDETTAAKDATEKHRKKTSKKHKKHKIKHRLNGSDCEERREAEEVLGKSKGSQHKERVRKGSKHRQSGNVESAVDGSGPSTTLSQTVKGKRKRKREKCSDEIPSKRARLHEK